MEERQAPAQTAAAVSALSIKECEARAMVAALSHRSMCDLAVRHVFKSPLPPPIRVILEFLPALRVRYGFVSTRKLTELLMRELGIESRQALRWIQRAVDDQWIIPRAYALDKRCTDNVYNPCREVPDLLRRLTTLYIAIGETVAAQLKAPLDTTAGQELLPNDVYMHPVVIIRAKLASPPSGELRTPY